jgi:hypothetical protein
MDGIITHEDLLPCPFCNSRTIITRFSKKYKPKEIPLSNNPNYLTTIYAHCGDCNVVAITVVLPITTLLRVVVLLAIPIL